MCAANSSRLGGGPSKITSAPTCMCDACFSWWRNEASIAVRRSLCAWCAIYRSVPGTITAVKMVGIVVATQVALGLVVVALVATDSLPFLEDDDAAGGAPVPRA